MEIKLFMKIFGDLKIDQKSENNFSSGEIDRNLIFF